MGKREALGILGGMGTRATWRFCQLLTNEFNAEKEWDHPRVNVWIEPQIPSRTRALLYGEESPEFALVNWLARMAASGITHVAVPCNSVHLWREVVMHRLICQYQIEQLEWLDMISLVKAHLPDRTLVVGGYVTMHRQLYGSNMIYPTDEYDEIARLLERLRRGVNGSVLLTDLVQKLEEKYKPDCILLACTELALCDLLRVQHARIEDSSALYAKEVAKLWNKLSFS